MNSQQAVLALTKPKGVDLGNVTPITSRSRVTFLQKTTYIHTYMFTQTMLACVVILSYAPKDQLRGTDPSALM